MVSSRSVLRYPGGKYRARKILYNETPKQVSTVLAPFLGGGSFELYLTSNNIEVIGTDNFCELMVFWEVLLSRPQELYDYIKQYLNKVDKKTFNSLKDNIINKKYDNNIELAGNFFIVNRCSFSGATLSGGYSRDSSVNRFNMSSIEKVRDFDNKLLSTTCLDYRESVKNYHNVDFIFLDPPYFLEKSNLYGVKGKNHKDFDHIDFFETMKNVDTKFMITYNKNNDIEKLWKDFNIIDTNWKYGMNKSKKSSEIIIKNF